MLQSPRSQEKHARAKALAAVVPYQFLPHSMGAEKQTQFSVLQFNVLADFLCMTTMHGDFEHQHVPAHSHTQLHCECKC